MRWVLRWRGHFDAAHRLPDHPGRCRNLHGHRWNVEVKVETDRLNEQGMVLDFGDLKRTVDALDHGYLNDSFQQPTAENIAAEVQRRIAALRPDAVVTVEVWESPEASVSCCP